MGLTLNELAEKMKDIDFAMLATHASGGGIASRPMSNSRDRIGRRCLVFHRRTRV